MPPAAPSSSSYDRLIDPDPDLAFAVTLADIADGVTLARFRSADLRVDTKPDRSPVTEADRAAETAIRDAVAASGRGDGVVGEEFGEDGAGDRRWIVDPIDGTTSYLRGVPIWATLLALEVDGVVELAFVSAPALGRRWWARRGGGAFTDSGRCSVSAITRVEDASVSTTSQRRMPPGWFTIVARAWANRGLGDFWHHCLVAEGALDVATDGEYMRLWDYAAVQLLVEEAGGRCTTLDGGRPRDRGSLLSTNGHLHDEVVALLAGPGPTRPPRS